MKNSAYGFDDPEAVLRDGELSDEEKLDVLRRWEYDQREIAVALEEGMSGPEPELLDRIVRALDTLTRDLDVERGAPTKQGGAQERPQPRVSDRKDA